MRDPWRMHFLLALHITAGSGAFVLAPLALVTAKGGKAHLRWGKIYFWCMAIVAFTALVMSAYRPILFLALVAIFSFYAAFTAYRVLGQKAALPCWTTRCPHWAHLAAVIEVALDDLVGREFKPRRAARILNVNLRRKLTVKGVTTGEESREVINALGIGGGHPGATGAGNGHLNSGLPQPSSAALADYAANDACPQPRFPVFEDAEVDIRVREGP